MENFIDIMTPAELEGYYGEKPDPEQVAQDRDYFSKAVDSNLGQLFLLFLTRGDRPKAETYYNRIKNPQIKETVSKFV